MTGSGIRLAIFDMDGTLNLERSPWQLIYEQTGLWDSEGIDIQQRWLGGEISYRQFCYQDVEVWRRHSVSFNQVKNILDSIQPNPHLKTVFTQLQEARIKICILSAGFYLNAGQVAAHTGFRLARKDESGVSDQDTVNVWANDLFGDADTVQFTFGVSLDPWNNKTQSGDPLSKAKLTLDICSACGIPPEEAFSCGDGSRDKLMFEQTGQHLFLQQPDDLAKVQNFIK